MTTDLIAIAALIVSIVAVWYTRKGNQENLGLQRRVALIEEARRGEEIARATQADIRAELRRGGPRAGYFLVITNSGGATAQSVNVEIAAAPGSRDAPTLVGSPFPVATLHSGDQVASDLFFAMRSDKRFEASITWTDPSGPRAKTQTVTLVPD